MIVDTTLQHYRDGLAAGELRLPRCVQCGALVAYPRRRCPVCRSASLVWEELSGDGVVYSFTVIRRAQGVFAGTEPYAVAYVEFAEGPRMLARVRTDSDTDTDIHGGVANGEDDGVTADGLDSIEIGRPVRLAPDPDGVLTVTLVRHPVGAPGAGLSSQERG